MVEREYECGSHGYFTVQRSVAAPTKETCPECGAAADRVYLTPPEFGFTHVTGGIPDFHTDPNQYSQWQKEKFKKLKEDLHPANKGKSQVTTESWAPKEAVKAVKEGRGN